MRAPSGRAPVNPPRLARSRQRQLRVRLPRRCLGRESSPLLRSTSARCARPSPTSRRSAGVAQLSSCGTTQPARFVSVCSLGWVPTRRRSRAGSLANGRPANLTGFSRTRLTRRARLPLRYVSTRWPNVCRHGFGQRKLAQRVPPAAVSLLSSSRSSTPYLAVGTRTSHLDLALQPAPGGQAPTQQPMIVAATPAAISLRVARGWPNRAGRRDTSTRRTR